jgi:hypothetical protein
METLQPQAPRARGLLAPRRSADGMPGWQIILIAAGAALAAAVVAVLLDRVHAARKAHHATTA